MSENHPEKLRAGTVLKLKMLFIYSACIFMDLLFSIAAIFLFAVLFPFKKLRFKVISGLLKFTVKSFFLGFVPKMKIYKFEFDKSDFARVSGGNIYIANHVSWLDPLFLLSLVPGAGIVLKSKYARRSIALLVKIFDFVPIGDSGVAATSEAFSRSKKILEEGKNLIIFPEGKRSYSGRLGDYKKLAFKLSKETGAPVVCAGFYYRKIIYGKAGNSFYPPENNLIKLEIFGVLNPGDYKDAQAMAFAAYQKTFRGLAELSRNAQEKKS